MAGRSPWRLPVPAQRRTRPRLGWPEYRAQLGLWTVSCTGDRSRSTSPWARPRPASQPGPRRRPGARPLGSPVPQVLAGAQVASPDTRWCVRPGGPPGGLVRGRLEPRLQFPPPPGARRPGVPPCVTVSARTQVWAERHLTSSSGRSDHSGKRRPLCPQGSYRKAVCRRTNREDKIIRLDEQRSSREKRFKKSNSVPTVK